MSESPKLLVLGATGLLGATLITEAEAAGRWEIFAQGRSSSIEFGRSRSLQTDLAVEGAASALIAECSPDVVINCVAMTDVDRCETDFEMAHRLNAELPGELAEACEIAGARLVHISTDAVFGGSDPPYFDEDEPSPVNMYGRTKLGGERNIFLRSEQAVVIRTNFVGWSPTGDRSLLEFFVNALESGNDIEGYDDVLFRPVTTHQLARRTLEIASAEASGIFHTTGEVLISKFDFGHMVAAEFNYDPALIRRSSIASGPHLARRSSRMDVRPSADSRATDLFRGLRELRRLSARGYRKVLGNAVQGIETT